MGRPTSKDGLLTVSQANYKKLNQLIDSLPAEEQIREFPPGTLNRNIRDVLGHLHHWHLMFLNWYEKGMKGEKPEMPAPGYTWKMTPQLNEWIWGQYRETDLSDVKKQLNQSYSKIQQIIKNHSDEELFEKKRYKWTGSTSLAAYLISATSSHYDWAFKLIKKVKK
ncbi:MAG: ClbS/DfsB family four-helix bundle protein [Bacteroidia bacterium]